MRKFFLFLSIVLISISCSNNSSEKTETEPDNGALTNNSDSDENQDKTKPAVNLYIENSGSMNGYVGGTTEFQTFIYDFLSNIKNDNITDEINLNFINDRIIPQSNSIEVFKNKLNPKTFAVAGGSTGDTDIAEVLSQVLDDTERGDVGIMVTDGIFSPGSSVSNPDAYLEQQRIKIKNDFIQFLNRSPSAAVVVYQLSANFKGTYYTKENRRIPINEDRPYFMWVIGDVEHVEKIANSIEKRETGRSILNRYSIILNTKNNPYGVKISSGKFRFISKRTISRLRRDSYTKRVQFTVSVDFDGLLLNDEYLMNSDHYEISNPNYNFTVSKASYNELGYTHEVKFSSPNVLRGPLSLKLISTIPDWVYEATEEIGEDPITGQTYGFSHQIRGVAEAFTFDKASYTEININIK